MNTNSNGTETTNRFDWNSFIRDATGTVGTVFSKPKPAQLAQPAPAPVQPVAQTPAWMKNPVVIGVVALVVILGGFLLIRKKG